MSGTQLNCGFFLVRSIAIKERYQDTYEDDSPALSKSRQRAVDERILLILAWK